MARHSINTNASAGGALVQAVDLDLGNAAIAANTETFYMVMNLTDSVFRGTLTAATAVTLDDGIVSGQSVTSSTTGTIDPTDPISIPPHGYILFPVTKTATTTAAAGRVSLAGMNSHGTAAQGGEFVYAQLLTAA